MVHNLDKSPTPNLLIKLQLGLIGMKGFVTIVLPVAREHDSGCPGARFRMPRSTIQVAREHDSGCPGARIRLPGSTNQVAREHNLALPWIGCPGARSWLPGSTFREHDLALPVISGIGQRLPGSTRLVPRRFIL